MSCEWGKFMVNENFETQVLMNNRRFEQLWRSYQPKRSMRSGQLEKERYALWLATTRLCDKTLAFANEAKSHVANLTRPLSNGDTRHAISYLKWAADATRTVAKSCEIGGLLEVADWPEMGPALDRMLDNADKLEREVEELFSLLKQVTEDAEVAAV
ncbi:hypothetical protein QCA50_012600 [Cerrena zonata]|uniref:Uncharacterized protein n=1 Tax=Cerrena zonata TaxID=2478898 RepID=A0AAW0FU12_9APHY